MLLGLSLGLVVALGVYLSGSHPGPDVEARVPAAPRAASSEQPADANAGRAAASAARTAGEATAPQDQSSATRFDFYHILPQYEVVIPEVEAPQKELAASVAEPGRYVLQAGSFTSMADADRRQASLALLGVESRIQRVTIDDHVFHRVRVGPLDDLDELNRVRGRLRDARVDTLLMKVQE
jgi:cell division protein FtsN